MNEPQEAYAEYLDKRHSQLMTPDSSPIAELECWAIRDDGAADWALRRIGLLEAQKAKRAAFVIAEKQRLDDWQAQEDKQAERGIEFFTSALRSYYESLKIEGVVHDKRKTYRLPHGRLSERTALVEYERDDAVTIHWMQSQAWGHFLRTKTELAWNELKALITPMKDEANAEVISNLTGEIIPGLRVKQPERQVFSVKPEVD